MCGIVGVHDPSGRHLPDRPLLERMTATLRHRGPDAFGYHADETVRLGHARLSIIDLPGGGQPLTNEDGSVIVVFNGEIYNFAAMRRQLTERGHRFQTRSDTEILVHAYEEYGLDFPALLDGMFAFAVWDTRRKRLLIARDRFGEKPLYYCRQDGALLFASEARALVAHPGVSRDLDHVGLGLYLLLDYVPTPRSVYRQIRKLPPGSRLTVENGHLTIDRYWDLSFSQRAEPAEDVAFETLLRDTVDSRLIADVPVGIALSGGIDSASILYGAVAARGPEKIRAFSIGFEDADYDESPRARLTARHFQVHHECRMMNTDSLRTVMPEILRHLDEPFADASLIPTYLLSRTMREHVTVALGGDGGDELMAGYPVFKAQSVARWLGLLPSGFWRGAAALAPLPPAHAHPFDLRFVLQRFLYGMSHGFGRRQLHWMGGTPVALVHELLRNAPEDLDEHLEFMAQEAMRDLASAAAVDRTAGFCMRTYLADDILVKVDRAAMAVSLEYRSPFLGNALAGFLMSRPPAEKMSCLRGKVLLRRFMRGRLPSEILAAPKRGFGFPISRWFRGAMKEDLEATLRFPELSELFQGESLGRLFERHQRGHDQRQVLWRLYVLGQFLAARAA